jgi:hypothetical protein
VSRVALLDADGRPAGIYEEDLMFPPAWNRRTFVLDDFASLPPETVRSVVLSRNLSQALHRMMARRQPPR